MMKYVSPNFEKFKDLFLTILLRMHPTGNVHYVYRSGYEGGEDRLPRALPSLDDSFEVFGYAEDGEEG